MDASELIGKIYGDILYLDLHTITENIEQTTIC